MIRRFFRFDELGTDLRTEVVAGATTFATMSYILVVNPQILSKAGIPFDGVLFATALSSALASIVMGLWARYPIALAPGMGLNAYFAFSVVPQLAASGATAVGAWQAALGAVFISGFLFLLLSLFRVREYLVNAVPMSLKISIAAGIGLFIALIGLKNGGIIVDSPATLLTLGNLHSAGPLLTFAGVQLTAILMVRKIKGAPLITIAVITLYTLITGDIKLPSSLFAWANPSETFLALDIFGAFRAGLVNIIFAFFFVDLFDSLGTLIGVAEQGGMLTKDGHLPRAERALLADAIGTLAGPCLGTSTVTSYIESNAGISAGGKSGFTSIVVALLFLLAIGFAPVFRLVPATATAPILIIVGALMMRSVSKIAWKDLTETIPAFLTISGIALTFSIADGMAFGFISHAIVKGLGEHPKAVSPVCWILAALFILRYALLSH